MVHIDARQIVDAMERRLVYDTATSEKPGYDCEMIPMGDDVDADDVENAEMMIGRCYAEKRFDRAKGSGGRTISEDIQRRKSVADLHETHALQQ